MNLKKFLPWLMVGAGVYFLVKREQEKKIVAQVQVADAPPLPTDSMMPGVMPGAVQGLVTRG